MDRVLMAVTVGQLKAITSTNRRNKTHNKNPTLETGCRMLA